MNMAENDLLHKARQALEQLLQNIPGVRIEWEPESPALPPLDSTHLPDLLARITHESRFYKIALIVRHRGFPQQLRQALDQLFRYSHKARGNHDLIVAAPFITPDGAKVCQDDGVSYFDLAGNCRIALGSLYIERRGIPNPFEKNTMAAPSLYGMRGERILRTLLNDPRTPWRVTPLAKHTQVSAGTVSTIRQMLLAREWAKDGAEGILLTQPEALLRDWALVWERRPIRPVGFFTRLPLDQFEQQLAAFGRTQNRPVALTGLAAAWRYAPMTRYVRTQAYWDDNPEDLARALDLKETSTGANFHLLRPRDAGVFDALQTFDQVPVVCPVQTYLDARRDPARGEEAAEHLWRTTLFRG
jgi:hypothetical protein